MYCIYFWRKTIWRCHTITEDIGARISDGHNYIKTQDIGIRVGNGHNYIEGLLGATYSSADNQCGRRERNGDADEVGRLKTGLAWLLNAQEESTPEANVYTWVGTPCLWMDNLRSSLAETKGRLGCWGLLIRVSAFVDALRWSWYWYTWSDWLIENGQIGWSGGRSYEKGQKINCNTKMVGWSPSQWQRQLRL